MSIKVMSRVWETSKHDGSALLTLLAIADFADDEGQAFPSKQTLAAKTRMSSRSVQRLVQSLMKSGELIVSRNGGRKGTNLYIVTMRGDTLSPLNDTEGETPVTDRGDTPDSQNRQEPSEEPSETRQVVLVDKNQRAFIGTFTPAKDGDGTDQLLEVEDVVEQHPEWPSWYAVAYTVPGWKVPYTQADRWRKMAKVSEDLAERKAYDLRDWWPTSSDRRQKKGDPYKTWQNWCRRDRDFTPGVNGRGSAQRQPVKPAGDFKGIGA